MRTIYGKHLLMEGYVKDPVRLRPEIIIDVFDALVGALKMQYLQRPQAMRVPEDLDKLGTDEDEGGWSVIAQITTSHISIHTWPLRGAFMMDVFSCHDFDENVAADLVERGLGVSRSSRQTIIRIGPQERP